MASGKTPLKIASSVIFLPSITIKGDFAPFYL
jgi:hypothetical protein